MIAIGHRSLGWAVDDLTRLDPSDLAHLRVRSGEHIAAILLTAFLLRAPVAIDLDGGVDLLFDLAAQPPEMRSAVDLGDLAAFEIKSLPGDYRRHDAQETDPSSAVPHYTVVRTAEEIMRDAIPSLRSAAEALARKCPPSWSRNVFLVTHPFDHFAVETVTDDMVAPGLKPLSEAADMDLHTVWVLWVPDHLTMWSVAEQRWTEMFFRAINPDEDVASRPDGLAMLQAAEATYLRRVGAKGGSPYLFRLTTSDGAGTD